ncbi:MAG TPA: TlpA disulfide reductase family protein, partial [Nitrosopumilaceae archaeon]|nr:TlpA disulfide reductase family protein [Nitrosopumilaceae archaeon]
MKFPKSSTKEINSMKYQNTLNKRKKYSQSFKPIMNTILMSLITISLLSNDCMTQPIPSEKTVYPVVGKLCPDFKLQNIKNYALKTALLKDFRGKWLILDFWTRYCSSCLLSMPKMDSLQKEFKDRLQIILVGYDEEFARTLYRQMKQKFNLNLPEAYDRELWEEKFIITSVPYILIIDDKGIIQGITTQITKSDIISFLKGGHPELLKQPNSLDFKTNEIKYTTKKPLFVNGNAGSDTTFLYRSVFYPWNPYMSRSFSGFTNAIRW